MKQEYENEDEIFENRESHSNVGKNLFNIMKKFKILISVFLIVSILIILELSTNCFSNIIFNTEGNTIGNIINGGYSVEKGKYIYYAAPSEDMNKVNINRIEKGKNNSTVIFQGDYDIRSLNVKNNKIYFVNIKNESISHSDTLNNQIYCMNLDGKDAKVINDNEFSNDFLEIYVVKNRIYYVGTDNNVYSMDLNGGNRELEVESNTGFLAINDKYIVYNKSKEDNDTYVTFIKPLGKDDEREVVANSLINIPIFYNNYIYYIDEKNEISRISLSGGSPEKIYSGSAYNMNIYDDNIYYLNYRDEANEDYTVCIFKMNIDEKEPVKIKELNYYSSFINLVNGYIYSTDLNPEESKSYISLINIDDFSETILQEWKFGQ